MLRVSVRGTLTDAHDESTRTQIKGPRLDAPRLHAQLSTPVASNAERASCESTRARVPVTVEYGNRLVQIERPRAQGRRPPPDAGTRTRSI